MAERARVPARDQWRLDRAAAPPMHDIFPGVATLSFDLKFEDAASAPPAAQLHIFHPAATAFFEFLCPYTNCSGRFDLGRITQLLVEQSSAGTAGAMECQGTRSRDGVTSPPCGVRLVYVLSATYGSGTGQVQPRVVTRP
jgi:hypothetical protein